MENPWLTPYSGPFILSAGLEFADIIYIKLIKAVAGISIVRFRTHPKVGIGTGNISKVQYILPGKLTLKGSLKSNFDDISQAINIQKENIKPEIAFHLISAALQSKKVWLPFNERSFVEMEKALRNEGLLSSYTATNKRGQLVGVHYTLEDESSIYALISGVPRPPAPSGTHNFIRYHVALEAAEKEKIYDLCGSRIPGVRKANLNLGAMDVERKVVRQWKVF